MSLVSERGDRRRFAAAPLIALALIVLMAFAQSAQAVETVYWDNYDNPTNADTVSFADISGGGGGLLNLGSAQLNEPEGMAYDTVTNRLFVADSGNDDIVAINLDGSGASDFTAPGAVFEEPQGVAVDPATRSIYWANSGSGSIGWAKLDGSAGGLLDTTGATLNGPYKIAIDPVAGRVYWINGSASPDTISYASVNGGGGGDLSLTGASSTSSLSAIAVDPAGGRIYFSDSSANTISFAGLAGGGGSDVNLSGAPIDEPYGLALDPALGRIYWGNYGTGEVAANAIGFVNLAGGGGGGITPTSAQVNGPQDPVIIKSPTATGAPTVTRDAKNRAAFTCGAGSWGADYPGSFVYQAPRSLALQWTRNGTAVTGATSAGFTATQPGSYACVETATNQVGTVVQTSAAATVKAAKLKLTTKKKANAEAGDLVKFKVKAVNQGDLAPKNAKLCVMLPKPAKDDLKAPKCKKLGQLKGRAKKTVTVKVKVKPGADLGTDKLTFKVKGAAGKAAKSKIVIK